MANKINPASIHLGGDTLQYFAEYLPLLPQDLPASCELPPALQLELTPVPLVSLNESCSFQFPDVLPLPPVYNPPNLKFVACETLVASANITTCPATRNTHLTLNATGPLSDEDGGPGNCKITLDGAICVEACENFTGSAHITFDNATKDSNLTFISKGAPDCGFELLGNIVVNACETFSTTSNLTFKGAAKDSFLALTPRSAPDCGLDLSGIVTVTACEKFTADVDISVKGDKVVKKNNWKIENRSTPDCGFKLIGDVEINACADFTATGEILLKGPNWNSGSGITIVSMPSPDCGLSLQGVLDIKACAEFTASSSVTFSGTAGVSGSIVATPTSAPNCGIALSGNVIIDACKELDIAVGATTGGVISFFTSTGEAAGSVDLAPRITITSGATDCSKNISISLANGSVTLPASTNTTTNTNTGGGGAVSGVCYDCGRVSGCKRSISLDTVETNWIIPPKSSDCCWAKDASSNYIDMCNGVLNLGNSGNYTNISSGMLLFATGGASTALSSSSLRLDCETAGYTELGCFSATLNDTTGDNKGVLSGGFITLTGTSDANSGKGGRTELAPSYANFYKDGMVATSIDGDNFKVSSTDGEVVIYNGTITAANNAEADTGLDNTYIDKGTITVRSLDDTSTSINGAELTQAVTDSTLSTYLYAGKLLLSNTDENWSIDATDGQIVVEGGSGNAYYGNSSIVLTKSGANLRTVQADYFAYDTSTSQGTNFLALNTGRIYLASDYGTGQSYMSGYPGVLTIKNLNTTRIDGGDITTEAITINTHRMTPHQLSFCVDGVTKTAWVLMTTPE